MNIPFLQRGALGDDLLADALFYWRKNAPSITCKEIANTTVLLNINAPIIISKNKGADKNELWLHKSKQ